jgi:hypothetical protein
LFDCIFASFFAVFGFRRLEVSHTVPQPSIFKNKVFNDGVYREDIVDVQLHYQLYLAKMGTVEANAPLQAPCTPSKLSECQTDFLLKAKKKKK